MNLDRLVLGVLDISDEMCDPVVASKYRDLTISWSRYDYREEIIEAKSIDEILSRAAKAGHDWCLVLPYGHVIAERWTPQHWQSQDFVTALSDQVDRADFLVAGEIIGDADTWFGFKHRSVLVNLELYRLLGQPVFEAVCSEPIRLPKALPRMKGDRISGLLPGDKDEFYRPTRCGWNLIATSLRNRIPVVAFDDSMQNGMLDLSATCPARTRALAKFFNEGIDNYCPDQPDQDLAEDQITLLNSVQPQTSGARNGVFLWNIEAYTDIETASDEFQGPLTTLYSVAAGFKPNRILSTYGWRSTTRVVFFDYSPNALEIRKFMIDQWSGDDFPDFIDTLFSVFPYPKTFYQLWDGVTPDNLESRDLQRMWQRELQQWGGAQAFRDHWQAYRELPHEFVCCNILTDPSPLFERITQETAAIIWWSNAFFTVYGNWFYSLDQRRQTYEQWIRQLAGLNPELFLFGSDYNNVNVNSVRAAEYLEAYRHARSDGLTPCRLGKTVIRM